MLQQRAQRALDSGHYRDAIAQFKALLKTGERSEWRAGLAAAYLGRAGELTAKGMLKEALTIGEVRRELCPEAPLDPRHVALLVRAGHIAKAVQSCRQAEKTLDRQALAGLRCRFAALHLSGESGLDAHLDADDPVIAHGAPARAALDAYCRGDDAAVAQALDGIPFRSPYREWVQILKALIRAAEDAAGAEGLLSRIEPESPFAPVAKAARLALLPDSAFPAALAESSETVQRFAAVLRGWTDTRLALWRDLQDLAKRSGAHTLLKLMDRHRGALGEDWTRRQGLPLLIEGVPRGPARLPVFGGRRLSPFEQDLLAAWRAEEEADPWDILDAWRQVIGHFRRPSDPSPGSDDALRIALIQRRLDIRWRLLDYPAEEFDTEQLPREALDQLEESLHFDPDDRPTHTRLIAYYLARKRLKDARHLLDRALQRWPDDVAVLGEALATAVAGGAFKKAAAFARRVLELDPINSRARGMLLEAHLAHARKQTGKGRVDLADRELEAAAEWAVGEKAEAKIGLLRGFLELDADWESGAATLGAVVGRLGGGLTGQLALAMEMVRLDRPLAPFIKKLGLPRVQRPEQADLLAFLRDLRESLDAGQAIPKDVAAYFEPALKRAAGLELAQQDFEGACETLRRCGLEAARLAHARGALKRWPGLPVFELHAFEAKHEGRYWNVGQAEIERLEKALERARTTGDTRTAHRIGELLEQVTFQPTFGPRSPAGLVEEPPPEIRALIEEEGIEGLLSVLEGIGGLGPDFKEMEELMGRERMLEALEGMLNGADPEDVLIDADFDRLPPGRPPKRRKSRKTGGERAALDDIGSGKDSTNDDSPFSDQLDLFE